MAYLTTTASGQPVLVLKEGTTRNRGKEAQRNNIMDARAQDDMVGDGTTTAVVLAGELLKKAEELLEQNIHPTIVVSGYRKAALKAIEVINNVAMPVEIDDRPTLKKVAITSMSSKAIGPAKDHLADMAIH